MPIPEKTLYGTLNTQQRNLKGTMPGETVLGIQGNPGRGILSIDRISGTGATGSVDTYRITYTDNTSSTFIVRHGTNGQDGATFIPFVDVNGNLSWSNDKGLQNPGSVNIKGLPGNPGRGIVSIRRTSGTGTAGSTDVYTITYTDGTTSTFTVYNGRNGGKGGDGATFTPFVDEDGNLSWSNNNGLANPGTVNIKGDRGDPGVSGVWVGSDAPTDGDYNVWVDPDGTADLPGGESGEDGFSPIAKVEQTSSGAVISITDKDGTTTATINNGKDGEDGVVSVAGAKVGQTVTIAAVDENGVPTAWEAVDFPSEGEYELIQTVTVEEEGIKSVIVKKFPDGKPLSLNKAFATLKFPLLESDITTGSLEFNIGSGTNRIYSSYSSSLELKPNSLGRYFQMTVLAEINGGVLVGESNMSVIVQLESSRRVIGPVASYIGNKTINNVSASVANGIPVGSVFELYGVRA